MQKQMYTQGHRDLAFKQITVNLKKKKTLPANYEDYRRNEKMHVT